MLGVAITVLPALACSGSINGGRDGQNGPGSPGQSGASASSGSAAGGGNGGSGADGSSGTGGSSGHAGGVDPGRVTLHRLNRVEYANTVRDLLGTTLRPSDDFPADDRGYGFDNIADVLSLAPVQVEMYFNAAQALIDEAMSVVQVGGRRYEAETMEASTGGPAGTGWNLNSAGTVQQSIAIESDGEYRIAVRAWAQQGGPEVARMSIDVNALPVAMIDVVAEESTPATYEAMATLEAGTSILGASFLNDFYDAATSIDRNLIVDWVEIEGPLGVDSDNPLRARIMVCEPDPAAPETCLRDVIAQFGRRAFRKPLATAEVDALLALATDALEAGDDLESATRLPLRAMLVSPQFLFRVEADEDPASLEPHALSDHELASRLSYFLWSSMPDETLLALADDGELGDPAVLRAQVARMLQDDKASALVDNFVGQWLFIRAIDDHEPDYAVFPEFDEELRTAMRAETVRYVSEFVAGNESMNHLLDADFTFVNERLASHYGMTGITGDALQRVTLEGENRRGLITQGSVLMVTSYATRTSPVKRGKWVLEQLLCSEPAPPPPNVPALAKEDMPSGSLRERMEAHRANPVCASCHTVMDPIGFGLESYDGIGRFRETDQGFDIDPSGELGGVAFDGALELTSLLTEDPRLPHCMAEQLLTYALGRGIERFDNDDLEAITAAFIADGQLFPKLVEHIVLSDAFRMRRGEIPGEDPADAVDGGAP